MPRVREPLPQGEVKIPGPPTINSPQKFNWFVTLLPVAGILLVAGLYATVSKNFMFAVPMVAMSGVSFITSIVGSQWQRRNQQKDNERKEADYADALRQKREELERWRREQQRVRINTDPDIQTLLSRVESCDSHMWERRPDDDDFLCLRLGMGTLASTVTVTAPHPDMPDPRLKEAHSLEAEYAVLPNVPVVANLRNGPLGLAGSLKGREGVARALVCHLAVHHSPDEVHLLAVYSPNRLRDWQWLKWLPHTYALEEEPRQYLANDYQSTQGVLKELLEELHRRQNQLFGAQHGERVPTWPWLVVLVEDYSLVQNDPAINLLLSAEGRQLNVTAIFMVDQVHQVPMNCTSIAEYLSSNQLRYILAGLPAELYLCLPDIADVARSEQLARQLAPFRVQTFQSETVMPANVRLLDLMGIADITAYDAVSAWGRHASDSHYLKVPIGERRGNQPLILDLNHTGHGPHGLVAGTTGSGKSELLQTLVVALALTHHPYDLGFVLVDFKGGGTFSELAKLPHTLGMVTDLGGNLTERALVALEAEMDRRKQMFNDAGVSDIGPYQQLYWQGRVKEPLPRLVVIIDEFAELVTDYPDFMDGLIGIARVGRSLGLHLILATQSPAGVVKQQIWANAKFRICLRVESRNESMEMLHRQEAANLPRLPGRGYLQVGNNDVFELFQVARVAGRYRKVGDTDTLLGKTEERIVINEISPLGRRDLLFDSRPPKKQQKSDPAVQTDLDVVVEYLAKVAGQMKLARLPSPWPEPLPERIALPDLLARERFVGWNGSTWVFEQSSQPLTRGKRFCSHCGNELRSTARFCPTCGAELKRACRACGALLRPGARFCNTCGKPLAASVSPVSSVPSPRLPNLPFRPWLGVLVGLVDDPARQRQEPLLLELNQQDGHLIVVGAPASGKEMLLRTLVVSLARTHAPDELHFYLLDLSGQALQVFERLPHVGSVLVPGDDERVRRLLRRLLDALDERKALCLQNQVDDLVRLRELQPARTPPAVVVIITGFSEFRTLYQDELLQLMRLIREGGPYGLHFILVGDRAADIPPAITTVVSRRIALRLADVDEFTMVLGSRIKLGKEQRFPAGRGWVGRPPLEFQAAYPGEKEDEASQVIELQQLAEEMDKAWQGLRPEPIEVLPDKVPLSRLLAAFSVPNTPLPRPRLAVPVGLDAVRLRPVLVDLVNDGPNFIVASTPQGGKTTLLLTWLLSLAEFNSPQQVQFVLVSGRRNSLGPLKDLPHVLGFCRTAESFVQDGVLTCLAAEIERRNALLNESASALEMEAHIVVVFDDYEDFFQGAGEDKNVQEKLALLAKRGRDVNVHAIVAGPLPDLGGVAFRDPLVKQLKIGRSGFLLRLLEAGEQNPLGLRVRAADIQQIPPGRGFVVRSGNEEMLQVAMPGDVAQQVSNIQQRWSAAQAGLASWPSESE